MSALSRSALRQNRDLFAGLLFIGFGVLAVAVGGAYPIGTATEMGPGYFPAAIGGGLIILGAAIALRGIAAGGPAMEAWTVRPVALITLAVLIFAGLLETAGLAIAAITLVIASRLAGWDVRPGEILALALGLAAFAVALFVGALDLPIPVWPK